MYSCSSDTSIRQWDCLSGKEMRRFEGHLTGVYQIIIEDEEIWSVSADKTAKQWDLVSGECCDTITHDDYVKSCVKVGEWLVTGGRDEHVRIWNIGVKSMSNGLILRQANYCILFEGMNKIVFLTLRHYGEVNSLRVRGNTLYSGGLDGTIRQWSLLSIMDSKID